MKRIAAPRMTPALLIVACAIGPATNFQMGGPAAVFTAENTPRALFESLRARQRWLRKSAVRRFPGAVSPASVADLDLSWVRERTDEMTSKAPQSGTYLAGENS